MKSRAFSVCSSDKSLLTSTARSMVDLSFFKCVSVVLPHRPWTKAILVSTSKFVNALSKATSQGKSSFRVSIGFAQYKR